ncbi:MAG: hypothetical protein KF873_01585 [Gemmataceae bacterium]|nr:hypothetical protein [Gemmataceae bacterium]
MRKSRTINLLLLGGSILAFSTCICAGCGRRDGTEARLPYDPPWYDAQGKPIAKEWKMDENGKRSPAQTAYDASGKPIQFDENGNAVAPPGTVYSSSSGTRYYRSGGSWWPWLLSSRSSSYSSYGSSSSYRSGPVNTGSTYFGGSRPGSSSAPSKSSGSFFGGSVSRGGFGGSASSAGS